MKVGFIIWNPFQLIQFKSIALKLEKPTIFIIRKNNNLTGNDSNLLIVFYVQIMPDDLVMQLHRF